MKLKNLPLTLVLLLGILGLNRPAAADDLANQVDLAPLRLIAVQHNQTIKTLDSFARQTMKAITGHSSIDGHEPVFTLLDMAFRPGQYTRRNIIKISNLPLRQEFFVLGTIDDAEKQRILKEGTVSLDFMETQDVANLLQLVQSKSVAKSRAINELIIAASALREICEIDKGTIPAALIAPATAAPEDHLWHHLTDILGNSPALVAVLKENNRPAPAALEHYDDGPLMDKIVANTQALNEGWTTSNVEEINRTVQNLGDLLPQVNPAVYPSHAKRNVEVIYNRWMMLTIPGAALYFIAFVLFLMSSQSGVGSLRLWGLRFMVVALLVHTAGIAVRWWLVGDIFPPIKNEFESVMFSAWFGAVVGLILELRRSQGIFGAAASFVGTLALVAIFTAPFVTHTEIGGDIGPVQGVLMSYWLYIHVTMVTAAYALIAMGFVLSSWWLIRYYTTYGTLSRSATSPAPDTGSPTPGAAQATSPIGGGAAALGFARTLALTFFIPQPKSESTAAARAVAAPAADKNFLVTLDVCNLVVLQLAFWVLGVGIVLGAIWADQSWGRPWGWDPKETFALVTWIVYLIIVHMRVATVDKAWWTAVLGCFGFFVMLFNWIGVNFLLVGLHSYA
ncbi:MAG: cytochrome c biogenesis protein CcsA [Planctomycetota bacterium]|nr:cytochrome c biogenesis protein CcsA [Planctomycetota bacterium]